MSRLLAALLLVGLAAPVRAQAQTPQEGALAQFGALFVGTWEGEGSRHVVEWGVGNLMLKASTYSGGDSDPRLVSEAFWYWDPQAESIRGIAVAIDMPVSLFQYDTRVEGVTVVHELESHGQMGGSYVERWTFSDDAYDWVLEQAGQTIMTARYRRIG
jgi:hypothetical protein